jgi:large subunit ribosomal protein L10
MIKESDVVGVVGIHGIAARQIQQMRANLRDKAVLKVVKNKLLRIAIDGADLDNIDQLDQFLDGQIALIICKENPFKLFQILETTKTKAPAKGGEVSPMDIKVEKGDTGFKPGPIIAELQRAGFPAAIEKGKVVFKKSMTIVKEGEIIPENVAAMLTKLEIYPMEVGLLLKGVYDRGEIIMPSTLDIDLEGFDNDLRHAAGNAYNLAVFIAYATDATIAPLIQKAHRDSLSLAISQAIAAPNTIKQILGKAYVNMLAVASRVSADAMDDDLSNALAGQVSQPSPASSAVEPAQKEEEEEEEVSEEEAVSGLGALFG